MAAARFSKAAAVGVLGCSAHAQAAGPTAASSTLYNGIRLAHPWPPQRRSSRPMRSTPPYLVDPPSRHSDRRRTPAVRRRFPDRGDDARAHVPSRRVPPGQPGAAADDAVGEVRRVRRADEDAVESGGDGLQRRRLLRPAATGSSRCGTWAGTRRTPATPSRTTASTWEKPALDVVPGTNITLTLPPRFVHGLARSRRARSGPALQDGVLRTTTTWLLYTSPDGIHWQRARPDRARPAIARRSSTTRSARSGSSACATERPAVGRASAAIWEAADFVERRALDERTSRCCGRAPTPSIRGGPSTTCRPSSTTSTASPTRASCSACSRSSAASGPSARSRTTSASATAATASTGRGPIASAFLPVSEHVGRLELGQRAVGRRLLPGRRRPAVLLRQRPPGVPGTQRPRRLQHRPGDAAPRRLRVDGSSGVGVRACSASNRRPPGTLTTRPSASPAGICSSTSTRPTGSLRVEVLDREGPSHSAYRRCSRPCPCAATRHARRVTWTGAPISRPVGGPDGPLPLPPHARAPVRILGEPSRPTARATDTSPPAAPASAGSPTPRLFGPRVAARVAPLCRPAPGSQATIPAIGSSSTHAA